MIVLWIALALIVAFLTVLLVRTALFTPLAEEKQAYEPVVFDRNAAVDALQQLVRCRTVSYADSELEDDAEFEKLVALLPKLYPQVARACTLTRLPGRALLYRWEGKAHDRPSVMMAHYDVVPVEEAQWTKEPFGAKLENGALWGRGVVDTKITFNGALFAVNQLISEGFTPAQDVYLAFSGGEEVSGPGAPNIVNWFVEKGVTPALVVDEGGAVVQKVFPGVAQPCALVGIAEKGIMNLTLSVASAGGHASTPAAHTPVGILSQACAKVENRPFPRHLTKPALEMFNTLGRLAPFTYRMLFANLWCFAGLLDTVNRKNGGVLNALFRTTVAFTQASGSKAPNVIPPVASFVANLRLNPEDSVNGAVAYVREVIGDERVQLSVGDHSEPSRISETGCEVWDKVKTAIRGTWQDCVVSPYLMVACSDSRHYGRISDHVYRFSACDLTDEERNSIHGNDEHIRVEAVPKTVEFYIRLMELC